MAPDYFVVLAEMRTGSNFVEESLNAFPGITCHGEVFNPHFIGHAKQDKLFGMTLVQRNADPAAMIKAMRAQTKGIAGFRLFSDHDPRVLQICLNDPACAKIILTRDAAESFVSLQIARTTKQWWLGDLTRLRSAKITFDPEAYRTYLEALRRHQAVIQHRLQQTGQAAFMLNFDQLADESVLRGLGRYLGVTAEPDFTKRKGKVQNPQPIAQKVTNPDVLMTTIERLNTQDRELMPSFEPRRGPNVPSYLACATSPLLFLPIKCGPVATVKAWMAALDGVAQKALISDFTRKGLRNWKRRNDGHRSFTVISHPLERAWDAFETHIAHRGPNTYSDIRETLIAAYKLPIPAEGPWSPSKQEYHAAFLAFLEFLRGNLGGQTAVRVDAAWASQEEMLRGMAGFCLPDMVLRADRLDEELQLLAARIGRKDAPPATPVARAAPITLAAIYDDALETAAREAYQRDYMMFGFRKWRA